MSRKSKLGKKVLAGKLTVDEARAQLGRRKAQKYDKPAPVVKSAGDIRQIQLQAREDAVMAQFRSSDDPFERETRWAELNKAGSY